VEAPALEKAYQSFKDKGVLFLGVFVQSNDKEIRDFAETFHQTFPVGKDTGTAEALDVKAIPVTLFIDKSGRIIKRHRNVIDYEELATGIEKLL
jgi:peroxiredoxin